MGAVPGRSTRSLGDKRMRVPRYLYIPFGVQIVLEVIARLTLHWMSVAIGLMIVTLCMCAYIGSKGVLGGRSVLVSALWALPLTILGFLNGSLGFAFEETGYDHSAYLTFVAVSGVFCLIGVLVGAVGGIGVRVFQRARGAVN
jgi:hypothetical protein